ncbi:MAG: SMC-Scp complex subunit ScpB [Candidatus Saganbacteria bacterium]|nr:SMC-Scp complex subunit ScpB [Candidatus Saganbacteria bacterium]
MSGVNSRTKDIIESLLFISKRPLSADEMDEICGLGKEEIEKNLGELTEEYASRGLQIIKLAHGYVLATRPEYSSFIEKYLNSPLSISLSPQAIEALSIIAYKQPVTKLEVENIRGVMCDAVINTLLEKRLIKEAGRSDQVGRPILYVTTIEFLKHFGLHDLGELPKVDLEEIAAQTHIMSDAQPGL